MENLLLSDSDKHLIKKHKVYLDKSIGYYRMYLGSGKYVYLHRYILNAKKGELVDHINRNKNDNRRDNLRIVSFKLNSYNRDVTNDLGRGIYFDKVGNRFRACISHKNKTLKLGSFKCINEAKIAYNKKAYEIYGENAYQHLVIQ